MKTLIILSAFLFSVNIYAQDSTGSKNMEVKTSREASYPGGDEALFTFLSKNMKYSQEAKINKAEGDIMVSFVVEPDSSISTMKIIMEPGFGCGESLKAVLSKIKYTPALVNGVKMKSKVILTVPVRAH